MQSTFKIGLFGIGLDSYWPQFRGLKSRLEGYLQNVESALKTFHPHLFNAGLIDNIDKAFEAGQRFRQEGVDIIFLYLSTYGLSATVLPVVQRVKVPVIILNLSPSEAIDYERFNAIQDRTQMTGEWLAYCSACPVPELANVFKRVGIPFFQITGTLDKKDPCWTQVKEWIEAGRVAHTMYYNRMGCMGHYYGGMLDVYSDLTLHQKYFGGYFEMIEVEELAQNRRKVRENEIHERLQLFNQTFDIQPDCPQEELKNAARTSVALDLLVEAHKMGSIAYYYKGTGNPENEAAIDSIILGNSLLTARNIPVAGEHEIKNVQAMKILDSFGVGGSFTEFYAMDYKDDVVLMGHDGPGHITIAQGRIMVKPLKEYHGKTGSGLSVEMRVKNGPVTLLSVVEQGESILLLVAEAESVDGPILRIGNTNSRYRFPAGARQFVESWSNHGPAHHCAVGLGHIASKIKKLGSLLGMEVVQV